MKRTAHPARRVLLMVLGALAAVLVLGVGVLALKPSWIVGQLRGQLESIATRSLGRPVSVEKIEAHGLPRPGATVTNLRVEGEGNDPPFLEARRATATVQLWPLIRSLGKDVRVGALKLDDTHLNLVRREDGTWNYESLGSQQPGAGSSQPEAERETLIEDLQIRNGVVNVTDAQAARGTATVALRDIDMDLKGLGPGLTLKGSLKAAVAAPAQNVAVDFKVAPLPAGRPQPGQPWPQVTMHLRGKDLSVHAFRNFLPPKAAGYLTGGQVDVSADVKTDQGAYALAGQGTATALKLRGEPASGSFAFTSRIDPAHVKAAKVDFTKLALKGPGIDLAGTVSVSMAPTRVRFALQGQELDLRQLLGALPEHPQKEATSTALPASMREELGKVDVGGTLKLAKVHHGALVATDVDTQAKLDDGLLRVQRGSATVYGGRADIRGSQVDLTKKQPEWSLKAVLTGMDTAQAFQSLSGHPSLQGRASGNLQLTGTGADWDQARNTLTGFGNVQLQDGALMTANLGETVTPVLTAPGQKGTAGTAGKTAQGTELKDLSLQFRVQDGWVAFTKPLAFQSSIGGGTLSGRVGLDERLELEGTLNASQPFLSAIAHGALPSGAPVTIPLTITGTLGAPEVKPGSPLNIAKELLPKVGDNPVNQARKGIEGLLKRPRK
ncbi:AsmA family protein [Corallococcus carmarthensis]|uniref:AsmA family protein n=1 Tax=Corallococcus carmarthensis TaxID=2316728 RepID=A0A3A8K5U6_9BACT|nr:AsmA family protein [Corallococcus carmarthensis]NOK17388.1 AsmA family protein [Corallococcus carmarthensis]RKH03440.1 AsmA family protein [Corallococcus carmarthensis]